jgi:hypothetical protein
MTTGPFLESSQPGIRLLQIASSFTCTPIAQALRAFVVDARVADDLSFVQYAQMAEYMLSPAPDSAHVLGTIILVRVEDWLRDDLKSSSSASISDLAQKVRQNLRTHVDEFVGQLAILSRRGKPIWFLACPSAGWISERHKLEILCKTYTNLLVARVQNLPEVTSLDWPASLLPNEFKDRSADRLGQIPFTPDTFDQLGRFVGQHIKRTLERKRPSEGPAPYSDAHELAAFLSRLRVHVRLSVATFPDRSQVDRFLRTAAAFSLTGEKRDISETEVDALLESGRCMIISVSDRRSSHGPCGLVAFHAVADSLIVDLMALSCAVLGKQVEYAVLSALAQIATDRGCVKLVFEYRSSGRNQPMLTFLKSVTDEESDAGYVLSVGLAETRIEEAAVAPGTWTWDFAT